MDYEAMLQRFYEGYLQPGDTAIDVGAHVGRHALPMAHAVGPGGAVFAFEPLPQCRHELEGRLGTGPEWLRRVIRIRGEALGDFCGTANFVVAMDALYASGLKQRVYDVPTRVTSMKVDVRRLDDFMDELVLLSYVKIDAEGGEFDIVRGGRGLIERFRPVVTFEFGLNSLKEYCTTPGAMGYFWAERQYDLFDICGRALTVEQFANSAVRQEVWDYVALPREGDHRPLEALVA